MINNMCEQLEQPKTTYYKYNLNDSDVLIGNIVIFEVLFMH